MKRYIFLWTIVLILSSIIVVTSRYSRRTPIHRVDPSLQGALKIVITGFSTDQGVVKIGLTSTKEAFDARKSVKEGFTGVTLNIKDKKVEHIFKGIPFGDYAIKYYHDANGNGQLDLNALGIPIEPYGFSNNARAFMRPPSFEKSKFSFNSDGMVHMMKIKEAGS